MFALRALGWLFGLVGFFMLVVTGLAFGFLDDPPMAIKVLGGVGAAMIAGWLMLDWGSLSNFGKDQTVLRSTTASLTALVALGVAVTANMVGFRYHHRWDLTETKRYTLAEQSISTVKGLDKEVEVIAFFRSGWPEGDNFRDLMARYQEHTTLLKVDYYDPYANPTMAEQNKVMSDAGTVIVKVGDNVQRLETSFEEEAFTNALVRVTSDTQHAVCFVGGHGEREADDDASPEGLGILKLKLEGTNYKTSTIALLTTPPTPDACAVVVLASPRTELLPNERDRLAQYVAAGGSLVVALDPLTVPETAADFARYGLDIGEDVVIEADPYRQTDGGPTYVLLDGSSYDIHPVTSKLQGVAILALARSVGKGEEVPGLNVQVIASASESSWAETALQEPPDTWKGDAGVDIVGKVPLVATVEVTEPAALRTVTEAAAVVSPDGAAPAPVVSAAPELAKKAGGKVVVYGDGDFLSNKLVTAATNQDLALNAVAWMVGEEDQISIRPNEAGKGKLTLNVVTLFLSAILVLVVAPGLTIIGAVGTWVQRRRM